MTEETSGANDTSGAASNGSEGTSGDNDTSGAASNGSEEKEYFWPENEPNAFTTYEELVAGKEKFKTIVLQRASEYYDKLLTDIIKEMLQQKLSSLRYNFGHWVMYGLTLILTIASAIISILATTDIQSHIKWRTNYGIAIAILQVFLSVLASLSNNLNFGAKASNHRNAAATLKRLYQAAKHGRWSNRKNEYRTAVREDDDLRDGFDIGKKGFGDLLKSTKQKKNNNSNNNANTGAGTPGKTPGKEEKKPKSEDKEQADEKKGATLPIQIKQAVEQVDSMVHIKISTAFNVMERLILSVNESLLADSKNSLVAWEKVLETLYFQLSQTIIKYKFFPMLLPDPQWAVDETIKKFKEQLEQKEDDPNQANKADLLEIIKKRAKEIDDQQSQMFSACHSTRPCTDEESQIRTTPSDVTAATPSPSGNQ